MKQSIEQLAREERNAYMRKWRSENKDKVRKHNAAYWKRRVEKKSSEQGGDNEWKS